MKILDKLFTTTKKHYSLILIGKVQGVGLRRYVLKEAKKRGLCGIVQNNHSDVYIEIEGAEEKVLSFINDCRLGSAQAKVVECRVEEGELKAYETFKIARSVKD